MDESLIPEKLLNAWRLPAKARRLRSQRRKFRFLDATHLRNDKSEGEKQPILLEKIIQLFFAFVLAGAFETEGRLLHERDGLAIWDTDKIEMEALSNDAMILLIESE